MILGTRDDLLRDLEPHVGVLADAGLVVRDRDDGGAVPRDEREHPLHLLVLAGHRVDERPPTVDGEAGLQRLDDRRVDREGHVGDRLDELDRVREDRGLVGERNARIDVEHLGARRHLGQRVRDDRLEVSGRHLRRERLAPGGVDPLTDHDERPVEAHHDVLRRRGQHGLGHPVSFPLARTRRSSRSSV